jgi:hypothetical protein
MALAVQVHDDAVEVELSGLDAWGSLRRRLRVPMADVVSARVVGRDEALATLGWRLGGTYWPGRIAAGHYTVRGNPRQWAFAFLGRDHEALMVETRRRWPRYLVVQHPDRHDLAWFIGERIG